MLLELKHGDNQPLKPEVQNLLAKKPLFLLGQPISCENGQSAPFVHPPISNCKQIGFEGDAFAGAAFAKSSTGGAAALPTAVPRTVCTSMDLRLSNMARASGASTLLMSGSGGGIKAGGLIIPGPGIGGLFANPGPVSPGMPAFIIPPFEVAELSCCHPGAFIAGFFAKLSFGVKDGPALGFEIPVLEA